MWGAPYLFAERPLWAAIFWASYFAFFILSSRVFSRERNIQRGDDRDRGSKALIIVLSIVGVACAFAGPFIAPQMRIDLPAEPLFVVAMMLFWAGFLLYFWAVLTLGKWFRTSVQLLDGQRLVTSGPYRLLRHPAYTGGILLFSGIGLATGNWFSFAVAVLLVTASYIWRIHVEEAALIERFGAEFEARRAHTWAVIPLVW